MAFAANARAGLCFKFPPSASRKPRKSSWQERRCECLRVRIAQKGMWLEGRHSQTFYATLGTRSGNAFKTAKNMSWGAEFRVLATGSTGSREALFFVR